MNYTLPPFDYLSPHETLPRHQTPEHYLASLPELRRSRPAASAATRAGEFIRQDAGLTGTCFCRTSGNRVDGKAGGPVYWNTTDDPQRGLLPAPHALLVHG